MSLSSTALSSTLHTITSAKLAALSHQHSTFSCSYESVLAATQAQPDPSLHLRALLDGVKTCFATEPEPSNTRLKNDLNSIERFLEHARVDPSVDTKMLER